MTKPVPYKPFYSHNLNSWTDRLPIPRTLQFFLILALIGLIQHIAAWRVGALPPGEVNLYLAFSAAWLVEALILMTYLEVGAGRILDEFRPMLTMDDEEYHLARYKFTMIPRLPGTLLFLIGAIAAYFIADSVREVSPPLNFAFPVLTIGVWMIPTGLGFSLTFQIIRQSQQIRKFYAQAKNIDMFNLNPVYAFSKMTAIIAILTFTMIYLTPLILDPASFQSEIVEFQTYFFIALSLAIFYIPLARVNRRLVVEKDQLVSAVNERIDVILGRIHRALDAEDYTDVGGMRTLLLSLREEKELIEAVPTWPWKPATLRGFLSAIFLPLVLWFIQQFLERLF